MQVDMHGPWDFFWDFTQDFTRFVTFIQYRLIAFCKKDDIISIYKTRPHLAGAYMF